MIADCIYEICRNRRPAKINRLFQAGISRAAWLLAAAWLWCAVVSASSAATLSDPQVDSYNVRVGTETFSGLYKFTTNTLLVETAQAITNLGSDVIKLYVGPNTSGQSGVTRGANITNLITLVRDEPSYRKVFDMPFRNVVAWAYPLSNPDAPFLDGNYTTTEKNNDYREMYDLTRYLLTNYNNSGRTFYLGHWEGDGYLEVNGWTTNPSPAVISAMIDWLNNRQKAVDDAKRDTTYTGVSVYHYTEANRVRDAMLNGATNNQRMINMVVPYITNLDCLSYSSYDAQDLSTANLYATLDYMHSMLPTNKAATVPGPRMWIGEYGHGGWSTDAQEPFNRGYIQRLLNWNSGGKVFPFILYWEMYDNEVGKNFCLVDSNNVYTASWYLEHNFINAARLLTAQFKETNGRLPTDLEFVSLVNPLLNQPEPTPVNLSVSNLGAVMQSNMTVTVSGSLAQGVYGDDQAGVWVFYGRQDGGTNSGAWEASRFVGVNTHFNSVTFSVALNNLVPNTNYFFRYYAANSGNAAWASASSQFSTVTINPADYGSRMKVTLSGYNRSEALTNFPVLVNLSTNLPGFSYRRFASPTGGDLRFTDAGGVLLIPHEIDEWNTNGTSIVWVNVPSLSSSNDFIWAYWGNPAATNALLSATNGDVWPDYELVWHLKESGFPYNDSTQQHSALSGTAPSSTVGDIGRGCLFNGSSQYLNGGTANVGSAFTLSAWVKEDSTANNIQTLWANKASGWNSAGFALYINSYNTTDGKLVLETGDGTGGTTAYTVANAFTAGQWHLVTASVDENAGVANLYVDGVDRTQSGSVDTTFPNQAGVNLGRLTNGTYYFKGALDEARIEAGIHSSNWIWASWMTVAANPTFQSYSAPVPQMPTLTLNTASGNGISLTWAGSGVGFSLYAATNLVSPVVWTPVTNTAVWTNNVWQTTLTAGNGAARFYRLQSP